MLEIMQLIHTWHRAVGSWEMGSGPQLMAESERRRRQAAAGAVSLGKSPIHQGRAQGQGSQHLSLPPACLPPPVEDTCHWHTSTHVLIYTGEATEGEVREEKMAPHVYTTKQGSHCIPRL